MNAIRLSRHLDSDTLNLPELAPMVGRDVEIIVILRETPLEDTPRGSLDAFLEATKNCPVDPEALKELRQASLI